MVKSIVVACFVLLLAIPALAQDDYPKIQTSLGYANLSFPDLSTLGSGRHNGPSLRFFKLDRLQFDEDAGPRELHGDLRCRSGLDTDCRLHGRQSDVQGFEDVSLRSGRYRSGILHRFHRVRLRRTKFLCDAIWRGRRCPNQRFDVLESRGQPDEFPFPDESRFNLDGWDQYSSGNRDHFDPVEGAFEVRDYMSVAAGFTPALQSAEASRQSNRRCVCPLAHGCKPSRSEVRHHRNHRDWYPDKQAAPPRAHTSTRTPGRPILSSAPPRYISLRATRSNRIELPLPSFLYFLPFASHLVLRNRPYKSFDILTDAT